MVAAKRRRSGRYRYLLGDSAVAAARLRAQARLWDPVAEALFDRVGVKRGARVLEVGPGQGSLHVACGAGCAGRSMPSSVRWFSPAGCGQLAAATDWETDRSEPPEWPHFVEADDAFFASQGGDASVGDQLPILFRKAGLELIEVTPTIKTGHPGSPAWNWLTKYFLGVVDCRLDFNRHSTITKSTLSAQPFQ